MFRNNCATGSKRFPRAKIDRTDGPPPLAPGEVGKYTLRKRWRAIAIGSGQTAIPANKNSGAGSEKAKPHDLYFEYHSAVGALVLVTCLI